MTSRRQILTRAAWVMGGAVSSPLIGALLARAQVVTTDDRSGYILRSLNNRQNAFVTSVCDVIVPETDTPGASAAKVNEFIDMMLTDWYPQGDRAFFLDSIDELERRCMAEFAKPLVELDPQQQFSFVDALDNEMVEARRAGVDPLPVFSTVKELTLVGYYTSEIGMREELQATGPIGVADFGPAGPPSGPPRY